MIIKTTSSFVLGCILFFMAGCGKQDLEVKVNELQSQLDSSQKNAAILSEEFQKVDFLIDSITRSESYIAFNLETGTTYQEHIDKLRGLSAFVDYTRQKMLKLENRLAKENNTNVTLQLLISKMRQELETKDKIISRLRQQLSQYEAENEELIKLVDLQKSEIIDIEQQLKIKMTALGKAEADVEKLKSEKERLLADTFFEKAEATEEIAKRTNFAPNKKKETYQKALNLYKMAYESGRTDALARIKTLENQF